MKQSLNIAEVDDAHYFQRRIRITIKIYEIGTLTPQIRVKIIIV